MIDFSIERKGVGVIDQCLIRTSNVSRIVYVGLNYFGKGKNVSFH